MTRKFYTSPMVEMYLSDAPTSPLVVITRVWDCEGPEERKEYVGVERTGGYRWTEVPAEANNFGSRSEAHAFFGGYLFGQTNTVARPIEGGTTWTG